MEKMKSIADRLREAANPTKTNADSESKIVEEEKPTPTSEIRKEVHKKPKKEKVNNTNDISSKINDLSFEDDSFESITIRFPKKLYSKLKLLTNEKLSIQKTTIYAVNELLETDDIKQKLKTILKSLNE